MIEKMRDAYILAEMPMSEKLLGALVVSAIGLGVTFLLLWVLLLLVRFMQNKLQQPEVNKVIKTAEQKETENDDEVMAVIVSIIQNLHPMQKYRIVNITPTGNNMPWGEAVIGNDISDNI